VKTRIEEGAGVGRGFGDGKELFSGSEKESPIHRRCMLDL
jgi:hypothetical protein